MHVWRDNPDAICPLNFFEVGGIKISRLQSVFSGYFLNVSVIEIIIKLASCFLITYVSYLLTYLVIKLSILECIQMQPS